MHRRRQRIAAGDPPGGFSVCHVDGAHYARDLPGPRAPARILLGRSSRARRLLVAIGVCEGAVKFWLTHDSVLTPIAVGFNKVLFQKEPRSGDLNGAFDRRFPPSAKTVTLWTPDSCLQLVCRPHRPGGFELRALVTKQSFRMDAVLVPGRLSPLAAE